MPTKIITPTIATQVTQALQPTQITPVTQPTQATTPTRSTLEQIEILSRAQQTNNKEVQTFLANYSDPTELNSYIDALTNREAVSKEFGDAWGTISTVSGTLSVVAYIGAAVAAAVAALFPVTAPVAGPIAGGLAKAGTALAVPAIPAAAKVTYDYGIKPIVSGKPDEALLNTLMNLGETMDAAANPIKGLFIEGPEGFAKGTGLAEGGRVQYDYDTGNFISDMVLEIISDPLNWIEWPAGIAKNIAIKPGAKALSQELVETTVKATNDVLRGLEGVAEITEEGAQNITKKVTNTVAARLKNWLEQQYSDFEITPTKIQKQVKASIKNNTPLTKEQAKELLIQSAKNNFISKSTEAIHETLIEAIKKEIPDITSAQLELILKQTGKELEWKQLSDKALEQIMQTVDLDKLATDTIKALSQVTHYTDSMQKFLTKGAFMTSGYGAGIALIKKLHEPLTTWLKNRQTRALIEAGVFHPMKGVTDLGNFEEAKAVWQHVGIYASNLVTGATEAPMHNLDTFYTFMSQQFDIDQQLFRRALQDHIAQPNAQYAALDAICQEKYKLSFNAYLEHLNKINMENENVFEAHLKYLNTLHENIFKQASAGNLSETVRTSAQLYAKKTVEDLVEIPNDILKTILEIQKAKTPDDIIKTIYTLKHNDAYINAAIVNDPRIYPVLLEIDSSENIGAFLNNIISDTSALAPEVSATISDAVRTLKGAGRAFVNMRDLYDNISAMLLPAIDGVKADDLKRYILDQIFGLTDNVDNLLINLENTTMPTLMTNLELFLGEGKAYFKFSEDSYKIIHDQAMSALKTYLEAQQRAGLTSIKAAIVQDFTTSVETLLKQFPEFAQELSKLAEVNDAIKICLSAVRKSNEYFLSNILADSTTIFKAYSARQLSDMGLALRTIATADSLKLFDDIDSFSGAQLIQAEKMGKRILHTIQQCKQYTHAFTQDLSDSIDALYDSVWWHFIENDKDDALNLFRYLIRDNPLKANTFTRFAHLVELYKTISSNDTLLKEWHNTVNPLGTDDPIAHLVYRAIERPEIIFKTEFAWDAMAQSAFYAERELNSQVLNLIGAYDSLSIFPKKMEADFNEVKKLLSETKTDQPKVVQLERYSRVAKKVIKTLDIFKTKYNNTFDRNVAQQTIKELRDMLINFSDLNKKYSPLVDQLEQYWNGTLRFKQDPRYVPKHERVDEFTPFWEQIKEMNEAITKRVQEYNTELYQNFKTNMIKFDKDYWRSIKVKFDKDYWNSIKVKFDKDYWNSIKVKFDKDYWKFLKEPYNKDTLEKTFGESIFSKGFFKKHLMLNFDKKELNKRFIKFDKKELRNRIKASNFTQFPETIYQNYILELNEYNKTVYESYIKELNNANTERFAYYLKLVEHKKIIEKERKWDNARIYKAYIEDINKQNDIAYKAYIEDINKQNDMAYQEYIKEINKQNDIAYQEYIEEINRQNDILYNQYIASKKTYKQVTPWDPIRKMQEANRLIYQATDMNSMTGVRRVLQFTPEQLKKELAFRKRLIMLSEDDLVQYKLKPAFERLKNTVQDANIHFIYDPNKRAHIILSLDNIRMQGREVYLDTEHLIRETYKRNFNEFSTVDDYLQMPEGERLVDTFNNYADEVAEYVGAPFGDSQGEFITKEMFAKLYAQFPDEVKTLIKEEDFLRDEFFDAYYFNESVLGSAKFKASLGLSNSNMILTIQNSLTQAMGYAKAKTEYVHTVFDSVFSIAGENSIYKNFSDYDLFTALQLNPEYKLVAFVNDKKYGVKVREIPLINLDAIKIGRKLGAVVVPTQTYKDMYKIVNKRLGSAGLIKIWNRLIYIFKFGYLLRPGAWIRNFIDTNLKTDLELGTEARSYKNQARTILREFEDINDFILKRDAEGMLRREAIAEYFNTVRPKHLTQELYDELITYYKPSGILGNIMSADTLEKGTDFWSTFTHYTGKIIDSANKTEEINRLALLLSDLDKDTDTTTALARLSKTHFDYSFKTNTEQLLEMVFPFTTFTLRNLSYWAEALEKHPWLMRNYVHFMKPHWDFKDYTPEELATNYRAQTQIKYGQLKLAEFNDKLITFKLNPSIQDAIQMFSDPINNIYEKLAAPISVPLKMAQGEYVNPLNLIPGVGPMIQDIQKTVQTGSPVPSLIGVSKTKVNYKNANLTSASAYRDSNYHRPVYTKNTIMDSYSTKGVQRYRTRYYPIIDVAHDVKMKYSTDVYNRIKNQVKTDVYQGVRYSIKLDVNRFR